MRLAFHSNQLSERGAEVALKAYAHYSEVLLGHRSVVAYPRHSPGNVEAVVDAFRERFDLIPYDNFADLDEQLKIHGVDALYVIKGGEIDRCISRVVPTMVHAVFAQSPFERHGTAYAFVSEWLSRTCAFSLIPAVPHIVEPPPCGDDLRLELEIPGDAVVFGSYGGSRSFDVDFVRLFAVPEVLAQRENTYFIFMNQPQFLDHSRAIFLPRSIDSMRKSRFVNTANAMLHARRQGESFGMACAEFSRASKQIFSYRDSPDRHHHLVLKDSIKLYRSADELIFQLVAFADGYLGRQVGLDAYLARYTPEAVMEQFDRHLLHPCRLASAQSLQVNLVSADLRRPVSPWLRRCLSGLRVSWRRLRRLPLALAGK